MRRAGFVPVLFTSGALIALSTAACVKDDPIVTGNRDAAAPVVQATAVVAAADVSDDDAADCTHCATALDPTAKRGTLCRHNGARPSAAILNEIVACVCEDRCIRECANYCSGTTLEQTCLPCIVNGCAALLGECSADK